MNIMSLLPSLLALFLGASTPQAPVMYQAPTMNLSAIRFITCDEGTGSGFMIDDDVVATALHVAVMHNCKDGATGEKLTTYHQDEVHDFALMHGNMPSIPTIKVSCAGYEPRNAYSAYGYSIDGQMYYLLRQELVTATKRKSGEDFTVDGDKKMPGMRVLYGFPVPGMSGGPVTDIEGYAHGLVNAGNRLGDFYSFELKDTILCKR